MLTALKYSSSSKRGFVWFLQYMSSCLQPCTTFTLQHICSDHQNIFVTPKKSLPPKRKILHKILCGALNIVFLQTYLKPENNLFWTPSSSPTLNLLPFINYYINWIEIYAITYWQWWNNWELLLFIWRWNSIDQWELVIVVTRPVSTNLIIFAPLVTYRWRRHASPIYIQKTLSAQYISEPICGILREPEQQDKTLCHV